MRGRTLLITAAVAACTTVGLVAVTGHADRKGTQNRSIIGPDVIAWTIAGENSFDFDYYGSSDGIGGYAMATQSCNWGDAEANWYGGTDEPPTIMQHIFRLKEVRVEQCGCQPCMKQ
ncbi:MAG: hypothetical protein H8E86_01470, partial [Planctomycetes bacterium]|nr:hypothetical protein [Planctomycetota bacterium]